jgi:tRNA dimethylallyltransferase
VICQQITDGRGEMQVLTFDSGVEQTISSAIRTIEEKSALVLDPRVAENVLRKLSEEVDRMARTNVRPVLLCDDVLGELDPARRQGLEAWLHSLGGVDLVRWATRLDPEYRGGGRQRAARAVEVALLSGRPLSWWQLEARGDALIEPWYIVLTAPRPVLHQRIRIRADEMLKRGVLEEVAAAMADGAPPDGPGLDGVGLKEPVEYLQGKRSRESVVEAITIATRQYAKRQETWFRHQLHGQVMLLDSVRPPEVLAAEISARWAGVESKEFGVRS